MNRNLRLRRRVTGFGLVELMVALTIGLLMALAIGEIYVVMRRGEHTLNHLSHLQENARFIAEQIKRDVRMAGYYGGTYQRWNTGETTAPGFQLPALSSECFKATDAGVSFRWAAPLAPVGTQTPPKVYGSDTSAPFAGCLSGPLNANSDVLSVHYAGPTPVAVSYLDGKENGRYFLQSSILQVFGFFCPAGKTGAGCLPPDVPATITGTEYYPLVSRVYYVRDYAREPGDGIPTLMVSSLEGSVVQRQPLVEGVAVFQVLYGLDDNGDGVIDRYRDAAGLGNLTAARLADWNRVKTLSVSFVLRGLEPDRSRLQTNPAPVTYAIGGTGYTVDGRYLSRLYQVTAALRNPSDRAGGV